MTFDFVDEDGIRLGLEVFLEDEFISVQITQANVRFIQTRMEALRRREGKKSELMMIKKGRRDEKNPRGGKCRLTSSIDISVLIPALSFVLSLVVVVVRLRLDTYRQEKESKQQTTRPW